MSLILYRGTPPWLATDNATAPYPAVTRDIEAEVGVIGAGITGALVAHRLANEGIAAVIIDRRPPASGSTLASTALLSYEMDVHLADLISRFGEKDATRVYQLGRESISKLEEVSRDVGGGVDFAWRPCFFLARTEDDASDLRREYEARRTHGFRVELLARPDIERQFPFSRPAATRTPEAAEVDPVKLTRAALAFAAKRGAEIYTDVIEGFRRNRDHVILETAGSHWITCRQVVLATGYETKQFLDIPEARLTSTYVLATDPIADIPGWPDRAMICEAGTPYTYMRRTADNRVLIGGEDEDFADPKRMKQALPSKVVRLEGMLCEMFPAADFTIQSAWAGVFSSTVDGLPFIGTHPRFPGALFALGYGGNGITFAAIAAEIIRDAIVGRANSDARLFRFGRSPARRPIA